MNPAINENHLFGGLPNKREIINAKCNGFWGRMLKGAGLVCMYVRNLIPIFPWKNLMENNIKMTSRCEPCCRCDLGDEGRGEKVGIDIHSIHLLVKGPSVLICLVSWSTWYLFSLNIP